MLSADSKPVKVKIVTICVATNKEKKKNKEKEPIREEGRVSIP